MAVKKVTENPKITDQVVFDLMTPVGTSKVEDCYLTDPFKIDHIAIHYIEREFTESEYKEYSVDFNDAELEAKLKDAKEAACIDPSEHNLSEIRLIESQIESSKKTENFFYKKSVPVFVEGNEDFPAWISTDEEN